MGSYMGFISQIKCLLLDSLVILVYAFAKRVMKTQKITKEEMLEICQRILSRDRIRVRENYRESSLLTTAIIEVRRAA